VIASMNLVLPEPLAWGSSVSDGGEGAAGAQARTGTPARKWLIC
jgi:hypothetical protein